MSNIAFYLPNKGTKSVDCSDVFNGNPGIGGTEYAMLLLACSLTLNCKDLNITVYADEESLLPPMLKIKKVKDWTDLVKSAKKDNIHILILIQAGYAKKNDMLHIFPDNLKIIIWAHNFLNPKELSYYAKMKTVSRIVCAGYEQLDLYRDHLAFKKSLAIHNGIDLDSIKKQSAQMIPYDQRPLHVTYIGNLIPHKGFHILAKAWPQIIKSYPDAVLNVIGSGKLYNRNTQLGEYGIADSEYEKLFVPYLVDSKGRILSSVKFWGLLGEEKRDVLQKTRVGVPNPSGKTEICPYSAIDLQIYGSLVATIKCSAYLETVCPSASILYKNQKRLDKVLADSIIALLGQKDYRCEEVMGFLESNFSIDKVAMRWYQLFMDIIANKENPVVPIKANKNYRLKNWKETNRKIKNLIPCGYTIFPSLWYFDDFLWKLNTLLKRDHIMKHILHKYILRDRKQTTINCNF
jgi:glycosyltransferase involved in cell wall biosynthesis